MLVLFSGVVIMAQDKGTTSFPMRSIIIIAVGVLTVLGLAFGAGLAMASKVFEVEVDPKVNELAEILPQANCGACGAPGCRGFAEALTKGTIAPNACRPGGEKVAKAIGKILGVDVVMGTPLVATIHCSRQKCVPKREHYDGIHDCRAAVTLGANIYECAHACLGLGTCAHVCPYGAIYMDENDMPVVIESRCTACNLCVINCPVEIIRLTPIDRHVHVLCVSTEPIKVRASRSKAHKDKACIGCTKCVKACPETAITMVNTVARIDCSKCTNCEKCIAVCPTQSIAKIRDNPKSTENQAVQATTAG
jgi:RnfABCDGE-type electron transport complex B subunit